MVIRTRLLAPELRRAALDFPVIILTGPRRTGKTTLLRSAFPSASYRLLEDPEIIGQVRGDPRKFLDDISTPAILDEIQNTPEILNHVRARVDQARHKRCQWFLTGSQEFALMRGVTESMAGRAAVFQLLPYSIAEHPLVSPWRGGFPEPLSRPRLAELWYRSYLQTYLERDVRAVTAVRDLATFRRFMALLATRVGTTLNRSELAAPLGISIPAVSEWLGILETTMQIVLVQPFYENLGKRLVKAPKLYFTDSGLLTYLLGMRSDADLRRSPFSGPVFECFVAGEIAKAQINAGRRREMYYFRDRQGVEIDFLVPLGGHRLLLIEAKSGNTVRPSDAAPIRRMLPALKRYDILACVMHQSGRTGSGTTVVTPGVRSAVPADIPGLVVSS